MIHLLYTHTKVSSDLITTDLDGNVQHRECLKCVHCQKIEVIVRGSGKRRGWCFKCMGPTCGSKECDICVPLDVALGYD